ncbi:U11/U12 small nuclear ribonucleoprotein 48 kDa protein [Mercurialis annua]|uniref:U11/U12 small nuclear ribonucleoprotein 48 kDa protein n=1 Tax=Mercurialis annua TaxID=3986 RepID=UPI00215FBA03|nr:U11/U12 small nuclear ribonucleoprotein 48 kDa protein [Mercurialis annua]
MNPSSSTPYPLYIQNPNYQLPNHTIPNYQTPNPNFPFHHSLPQPPPPPPQPPQLTPITTNTPITDISSTLSCLSNLIHLSQRTLDSFSALVLNPNSTSNNNKNDNFISCPYNPNHLMPPESLFLHSLRCPSPLFEDPVALIDSLHYPKTLNLKNPLKTAQFNNDPVNKNSDLCLSLDGFCSEFGSNFFYKDCPGVVEFNDLDSLDKSFTLPGVLSVECANFVDRIEDDFKGFDRNEFRILPSDLWFIRREVEGWVDCPSVYSYGVFCAILRLHFVKCSDLKMWVIANSPRYGVVTDVYMRDHIYLLLRLCLNAIKREAMSFVCHGINVNLNFSCPVLAQVFMWIVSQLSVLYGEGNANGFVIHILRQCILEVSNGVLLPLEANVTERSAENGDGSDVRGVKLQEPVEGSIECKMDRDVNASVDEEVIFVSQVAASVAALRERALLEARIKRLRNYHPPPRYMRMNEHTYVSKRAEDERKKRSNYRAIIDHDGLPRKQLSNEDAGKIKTREELLAEERDYKRRRMSYRGKKLKRTTLQVMRDIIEEFMEEIKKAGGIGCFESRASEEGVVLQPSVSSDITTGDNEYRKNSGKSAETRRVTSGHYGNHSYSDHNIRSTSSKDATNRDYEQRGKSHHRHLEHVEYQRRNRHDSRGTDDHSGSSKRQRSHDSLHEQNNRQSERDGVETNIFKRREKKSSDKSDYYSYGSDLAKNPSARIYHEKAVVKDRHLRNSDGIHRSKFLGKNAFEDRYNPAESHKTSEDDVYSGQQA